MMSDVKSGNDKSSNDKQKVLVICPGRGTYNARELGYLKRHHGDKSALLASIDQYRIEQGQTPVSTLDGAERYQLREHSRGDNASALIWSCAYADYLSIDRDRYQVCALTGNSMGWYIALGCAGALNPANALRLINSMGTLMQQSLLGGQLIYPLVDEDWRPVPGRHQQLLALLAQINAQPGAELYPSIELGGMRVFGGNEAGLRALELALPPEQERFPMRLFNHAAFHTPLQQPIAAQGRNQLPTSLFQQPQLPLIDGRGAQWRPHATDPAALHAYTLGHQVTQAYDFTRALQVAVREYAPDKLIILGPGTSLGGAVAQALIDIRWRGWASKQDFIRAQQDDPYILSMGLDEQRGQVT
ncbi:MAG: [acyl-carrier-protein] S-malonyltransferase [Motiliproteus sp.]|jgi:[acyl-carrier-protein] S-malonyltransferase